MYGLTISENKICDLTSKCVQVMQDFYYYLFIWDLKLAQTRSLFGLVVSQPSKASI